VEPEEVRGEGDEVSGQDAVVVLDDVAVMESVTKGKLTFLCSELNCYHLDVSMKSPPVSPHQGSSRTTGGSIMESVTKGKLII